MSGVQIVRVTLPVEDVGRAQSFYTQHLGFVAATDRSSTEEARQVELVPPGGGAQLVLMKSGSRSLGVPLVWLAVDDVAAMHRLLHARGVRFMEPPVEVKGELRAVMLDSEGNRVLIHGLPSEAATTTAATTWASDDAKVLRGVKCPRCREDLREATFGKIGLSACGSCNGLLVEQRSLVAMLTSFTDQFLRNVDVHAPIDPVEDVAGHANCPKCKRTMSTFGYMGAKTVQVDRCNTCNVLWMDAEELSVMAMLWARTNRRVEETTARRMASMDDSNRRMKTLQSKHVRRAVARQESSTTKADVARGFLETLLNFG